MLFEDYPGLSFVAGVGSAGALVAIALGFPGTTLLWGLVTAAATGCAIPAGIGLATLISTQASRDANQSGIRAAIAEQTDDIPGDPAQEAMINEPEPTRRFARRLDDEARSQSYVARSL